MLNLSTLVRRDKRAMERAMEWAMEWAMLDFKHLGSLFELMLLRLVAALLLESCFCLWNKRVQNSQVITIFGLL